MRGLKRGAFKEGNRNGENLYIGFVGTYILVGKGYVLCSYQCLCSCPGFPCSFPTTLSFLLFPVPITCCNQRDIHKFQITVLPGIQISYLFMGEREGEGERDRMNIMWTNHHHRREEKVAASSLWNINKWVWGGNSLNLSRAISLSLSWEEFVS